MYFRKSVESCSFLGSLVALTLWLGAQVGCAPEPEDSDDADDDDDATQAESDDDDDAGETSADDDDDGSTTSADDDDDGSTSEEQETSSDDDDDDDGTSSAHETSTEETSTSDEGSTSTTTDETTGSGDCQGISASGGVGVGGVLHDFMATDQAGEMHSLHQYCKQGVALVISTEWCGPCNDEAPSLQNLYEDFKDRGVIVITMMVQSEDSSPGDMATAKRWADKHGLTHPVVTPPESTVADFWDPFTGYPSIKVIKTGVEVVEADPYPLTAAHLEKIATP